MLKSLIKFKELKFLVILTLLLTTLFSFLNLTLISQTTALAQAMEVTSSLENINQETIYTDINQVEQDTTSNYKFGQKIEATTFKPDKIKNDLCGESLDFSDSDSNSKLNSSSSNNFHSNLNLTLKFDPNASSTVIKIVKTKCETLLNFSSNSNQNSTSQTWIKLVWDNGLIGWVEVPSIQSVSVQITTQILNFGSIQTFAQENSQKTCKNFQFQIQDLIVLNQFPNLDLDDDGVGCEHLPISLEDQFVVDNSEFDTDQNGRVNCNDFAEKIYDPIILAKFSSLDTDNDGVGCESKKVNPNFIPNPDFDPIAENFVNIEKLDFELNLDEHSVDLGHLTNELSQVLAADWQYLNANDQNCGSVFCPVQSLAGLGRQGLWSFYFTAGLLQGTGQSVVDLLGQIWNLVTKTGEVIVEIINSIKVLFSDSKILLKLLQGPMLDMLKTDTMGRANLIGKAIGQFIPDIVLAFVGAGIAKMATEVVLKIKNSTKLASTVIKLEKFVGKSIKILNGKYSFFLKKVDDGVGISGKDALRLVIEMDDQDFEKILIKVDHLQKRNFLSNFKKEIDICRVYICPTTGFRPGQWLNHYVKHGAEFPYTNSIDYLTGANNLKNRTANSFILQKIDSKNILRKYNTVVTNEFISINPDGSFRTYFKPSDGINYWNKQPGR